MTRTAAISSRFKKLGSKQNKPITLELNSQAFSKPKLSCILRSRRCQNKIKSSDIELDFGIETDSILTEIYLYYSDLRLNFEMGFS